MDMQECCVKPKISEAQAGKAARREEMKQEFARTIKAAREDAGYSLDAVAHKSRISLATLRAMEFGRFDLLPGAAFVRGFVRNLCAFYGIPHEKLTAVLNEAIGVEEGGVVGGGLFSLESKSPIRSRSRYSLWSKILKKAHATIVIRYFHVGQLVNTVFFVVLIVGGLYCGVRMFGKLFNDEHLLKIAKVQPVLPMSASPSMVNKIATPMLPLAPVNSEIEKSSEKSTAEKLMIDKNQKKKKNVNKF